MFYLIISQNDKIMLFEPKQPPILSVWASCRTDCKRTVPGSLKLSKFESTGLVHHTTASALDSMLSFPKVKAKVRTSALLRVL